MRSSYQKKALRHKKVFCAAFCLLMITSCGRPALPDDGYTTAAVAQTASSEITTTTTASTTTTTSATTTTETIITTVQSAMTIPATETTTTTEPATTTTAATTTTVATTTTTPATTTLAAIATTTTAATTVPASPIIVQPKITYPPAKHYSYTPPYFADLTLYEDYENQSGEIWAASHLIGDTFYGFVLNNVPGKYLAIRLKDSSTKKSDGSYNKHPLLAIDVGGSQSGRVYIGESVVSWYGEGYLFWDFDDPECGWYTFETTPEGSGQPIGSGYYFDGTDAYLEDYVNGSLTKSTQIPETSADKWNLTEKGDLYFADDSGYSGFVKNGKKAYFGMIKSSDWAYRGQIQNGEKEGLGITIWDSGDIFIGQYENDSTVYGLFCEKATDKKYFVKNIKGTLTVIEEIQGIDVDFNKLLL
jgi:hypothetical protein